MHTLVIYAPIFRRFVVRSLRHLGWSVEHVMNITDVGHLESDADDGDDKMMLASKREQNPWEIAQY